MSKPPPSLSDLAVILLLAGVYTLLCHRPAYIEVYSRAGPTCRSSHGSAPPLCRSPSLVGLPQR
jgi:hypothetical protein